MNKSKVFNWIATALEEVHEERTGVDAHFDEILGVAQLWKPRESVEVVKVASTRVPPGWTGRLSLAIPLQSNRAELAEKRPPLARLEVDKDQPPSLYLFAAGFSFTPPLSGEEFRTEYAHNPWDLGSRDWRVEFSSFKDAEATQHHWEPSNTIWVTYRGGARNVG